MKKIILLFSSIIIQTSVLSFHPFVNKLFAFKSSWSEKIMMLIQEMNNKRENNSLLFSLGSTDQQKIINLDEEAAEAIIKQVLDEAIIKQVLDVEKAWYEQLETDRKLLLKLQIAASQIIVYESLILTFAFSLLIAGSMALIQRY
jgi:hypothetical protein